MRFRQQVRVTTDSSSIQVRTPQAYVTVVLGGVASILVGVSGLTVGADEVAEVVLAWCCLGAGVAVLRMAARSRIVLDSDRLVRFTDFHKVVMPTDEISHFYVDRAPHIVPWFCIWVRLRSGAQRPIQQCQVFGFRQSAARDRLEQGTQSLNTWLEDDRAARADASQ